MANYKANTGSGYLTLLDAHVATGTEATYTFTPASALNMKTLYREIKIIISGKATATFGLQMKVNASTDYNNAEFNHDTTTLTGAVADAASVVNLLGGGQIDGAVPFYAEVTLICNDATDTIFLMTRGGASHEGQGFITSEVQGTATTISSIEIKTSTSTWIAGTEISTYGVKR